jgi:hypothetical protein
VRFTNEGYEFARARIGNPHGRRVDLNYLKIVIHPQMFELFADAWCHHKRMIVLGDVELIIIGYFSQSHPADSKEITIYLHRKERIKPDENFRRTGFTPFL